MRLWPCLVFVSLAMAWSFACQAQTGAAPSELVSIEQYTQANLIKGPRSAENDAKNAETARYGFMRCAALFSVVSQIFSNAPDPALKEKMVSENTQLGASMIGAARSLKPTPPDNWLLEHIKPMREAYVKRLVSAGPEGFFKTDPVVIGDVRFCKTIVGKKAS